MTTESQTPPEEQREEEDPFKGNGPVTIVLPYGISNMVVLQAAPLFVLLFGSSYGVFRCLLSPQIRINSPPFFAAAVCLVGAAASLYILKCVLWSPALRGSYTAVFALYVLFAAGVILGPLLILPTTAFVFLPLVLKPTAINWTAIVGLGLPIIVLGVLWLFALTNLFEKDLWLFARLDGRCPACRQWRFGRIRRPRVIQCAHCKADLEFVRPG